VQLVTWEEFQADFEGDYYEHYFKPQLRACVDPLLSYVEPFSPGSFVLSGRLPEENVERFRALIPQYEDFGAICLPVYLGWRKIYGTDRLPLPLSTVIPPDQVLPQSDLAEIPDYEGFLTRACEIATEGLAQFRTLLRPQDDVHTS
jgi:hypothetical protein